MIRKLTASFQFDSGKSAYQVGVDGITKIDYEDFSPTEYCNRRIYKIFKGDKLSYEVYDTVVGEVFYQ